MQSWDPTVVSWGILHLGLHYSRTGQLFDGIQTGADIFNNFKKIVPGDYKLSCIALKLRQCEQLLTLSKFLFHSQRPPRPQKGPMGLFWKIVMCSLMIDVHSWSFFRHSDNCCYELKCLWSFSFCYDWSKLHVIRNWSWSDPIKIKAKGSDQCTLTLINNE